MQIRCQDCGHSFLLTPSGATQSVACENCGGKRLERDQPSPVKSDGEMSATNPGLGINQQGIPEREGIFEGTADDGLDKGWQPLRRRDESFASVKTAAGVPAHQFQVDDGMIHFGNLDALKWFDAHVNGIPARDPSRLQELVFQHSPHKGGPVQVNVHHPEHEQAVREIIENGAGMAGPQTLSRSAPTAMETMRAIGRGEIPPPEGADPNQVTSRVANDFDMSMFEEPEEGAPEATHKFIIDKYGQVHSKPNPTHHEEIAVENGLLDPNNPGDFPKGLSQGELYSNGDTTWYTHDTPHSAEALSQMLHGHFGHPVTIDPDLKPSTSEERFKLDHPDTRDLRDIRLQSPHREEDFLEALKQRGGRPFGYYDNPFINRGGSDRTLNMDPYMPWTHEATEKTSGPELLALLPELLGGGGAAVGAAEGGAAAGGAGGMGGLMKNVLMGKGIGAMLPGGGKAPGMPSMPQAPAPTMEPDPSRLTHTADLETPVSNPGYHEAPDGDTKQFGVGDHDPAAQNPNIPGEAGGSAKGEDAVREHAGFGPDSPGIERAQMLLPLLLHYYHSDESGMNDPLIKSLHEQLDKEVPGYLDSADDEAVRRWLDSHEQHGVHARTAAPFGWGAVPDTFDTRPEGPAFAQGYPQQQGQQPEQQGICPFCKGQQNPDGSCPTCGGKSPIPANNAPAAGGARGPAVTNPPGSIPPPAPVIRSATLENQEVTPGHCHHCGGVISANGICPQCGASSPMIEGQGIQAPNIQSKVAGNHQGPTTPEQISAVQQLLIDTGRIDEVPTVPLRPELYANELSEVTSQEEPPPTVDPSQTPPPQPTQEIAPPGATMPVPNPASPQMQQPMARVADHPEPSAIDPGQDDALQAVPGDDQQVPDHGDNTQSWQTDNGEPLVEGQTYEMHSSKYEIPDIVTIDKIKPNAIVVSTLGEYSDDPNQPPMGYQHEISKEEADLEGLSFIPSDGQHDDATGPEHGHQDTTEAPVNTEPAPAVPQQEIRSSVEEAQREFSPQEAQQIMGKLGYDFDPNQFAIGLREELEHSDVTGGDLGTTARIVAAHMNEDPEYYNKLISVGLAKPQPEEHEASVELSDSACPNCSSEHISSTMSSPTTNFHECYKCGNYWETKEEDFSVDGSRAAAWILEDSGPGGDDFFAEFERHRAMRESGGVSRNLSDIAQRDPRYQEIKHRLDDQAMQREAGKRFTPKEQREFIDERGIARNKDKLDLANTHYESHRYLENANGENVNEAELFLGF